MDWRDKLRPASFRGVPFVVQVAERRGGRRVVVHEYPQRDAPWPEDLGNAPRVFRLEALVVGDDLFAQRDRLLDALEQEGPGTLVHPYHGSIECAVTDLVLRHSADEGRVARFLVEFTQSSDPVFPETFVDGPSVSGAASERTGAAAEASFNAGVVVAGVPEWVGAGARNSAIEVLQRLQRMDYSGGALGEAAALVEEVDETADAVVDLLLDNAFAAQLRHLLERMGEVYGSKKSLLEAYLSVEDYRCSRSGFLSELGLQADANALAVELLTRAECLALATSAAAGASWTSSDEALQAREDVADRIEALSELVDDATFSGLQDLRTALQRSVPPDGENLPHLETVTLPATTSSLLLAYRYYGDVAREPELVERNHPRYPAFLSPAAPLELLVLES